MSTFVVARKDILDSIRSRSLIALVAVFVIFAGGTTYLFGSISGTSDTSISLILSLGSPIAIFVPLIGILMGYKSIAGERESGSAKLMLSLPNTRRDVVFGKIIGRVMVLSIAILVGFVVAAAIAFEIYDSFPFTKYILFILVTILLGVVYLAFSLGLSATTESTSIALWGSVGFFIIFYILWSKLLNLLVYVVNGFSSPKNFSLIGGFTIPRYQNFTPPNWYRLLEILNPAHAYQQTFGTFTDLVYTSQSGPYYLQNWFGFVILAIWIVIPLVLGYARFRQTDL